MLMSNSNILVVLFFFTILSVQSFFTTLHNKKKNICFFDQTFSDAFSMSKLRILPRRSYFYTNLYFMPTLGGWLRQKFIPLLPSRNLSLPMMKLFCVRRIFFRRGFPNDYADSKIVWTFPNVFCHQNFFLVVRG